MEDYNKRSLKQWAIRLNNDIWALVVIQDALKQHFIQIELLFGYLTA